MSLYRKAVRSIQPSRAEMARRHAPAIEADKAARLSVLADIEAGKDAQTLYREASAAGDRFRSVALLGFLRRGMVALKD